MSNAIETLDGPARAIAPTSLGGLPDDAPFQELPVVNRTLFDQALSLIGVPSLQSQAGVLDALPEPVKDIARSVAPAVIYRGDIPLARMEWVGTDGP